VALDSGRFPGISTNADPVDMPDLVTVLHHRRRQAVLLRLLSSMDLHPLENRMMR
jgi:hypothetical protein